ncbi:MAG: flagellar biosynthesis anti-sigma factor FlgM [Mahellales bacterium]|jgi:flagellar biosynthesis anti-sigma factor FlgM
MRIIPGGIHRALGIYKAQGAKKDTKIKDLSVDRKLDKLELSDKAQAFKAALDGFQKSSDIREHRVRVLREEIQSGRYRVDSVEIAKRIIQEHYIKEKD